MLQKTTRRLGFTLIELLTVIAIIGILAGIIIPVTGSVREKAKKTKTRAQFSQWSAAFTQFKQEYGYWPNLRDNKINGEFTYNSTTLATDDKLIFELFTGKGLGSNGDFITTEKNMTSGTIRTQNRKRLPLYAFAQDEISSTAEGDISNDAVRDAFGNVEIAVVFDSNNDGFVSEDEKDVGGNDAFSDVRSSKDPFRVLSKADVKDALDPQRRISPPASECKYRGSLIIYTAGTGKQAGSASKVSADEAILSWR